MTAPSPAEAAREVHALFDDLYREFGGDVVEWLNERFIDARFTSDFRGNITEFCLVLGTGGPHVEICIDGSRTVRYIYIEPFKKPVEYLVEDKRARDVFDALEELVEETLLQKA